MINNFTHFSTAAIDGSSNTEISIGYKGEASYEEILNFFKETPEELVLGVVIKNPVLVSLDQTNLVVGGDIKLEEPVTKAKTTKKVEEKSEKQIAELQDQLSSTRSQVNTLTAEKTALESDKSIAQSETSNVKEELQLYIDENAELKAQLANKQIELEEAQSRIADQAKEPEKDVIVAEEVPSILPTPDVTFSTPKKNK